MMARLIRTSLVFGGRSLRVCRCFLIGLVLALGAGAAWSQEDDGFARDFRWLRSNSGAMSRPSSCATRPRRAMKSKALVPNALARARMLSEAVASGSSTPVTSTLPSLVDNSTLMYFPPIMSQLAGDCTCMSSAYYYNTFLQARDEGLDASSNDNDLICSPRFLFLIIAQGGWGATCTEHAMARLSDVGCSSVTEFGYSESVWGPWPPEAAWVQALENRPGQLYEIQGSATTDIDLDAVKTVLANGSCVVTRADFGANYDDYRDYAAGDGIDNHVMFRQDPASHGNRHSMCIIGYDDNKSYVDDRDAQTYCGAFILANSEGQTKDWYNSTGTGTKGFMWIAYRMFLNLGPPINEVPQFGYYDWDMPIGDPCHDDEDYPTVYYHDDRPRYRPRLYAAVGLNHSNRHMLQLMGGIGSTSSPEFLGPMSVEPTPDSPNVRVIDDTRRVAVDLTDGVDLLSPDTPKQVFVLWSVDSSAGSSGTMTSAEFFFDPDGCGFLRSVTSSDPPLTVTPGNTDYATVLIATAPSYVYVDASNTTSPWDGTPENPYQTIQAGINNAAAGEIVLVLPGTYYEGIVLTSNVAVVGSGPHVTTINSQNAAEAVHADTITNSLLEGFTIISGADYFALRSIDSTLTVRDCITTGSKSGFGGALSGSLHLVNCLADGNDRAGAWDSGTANLRLDNCTLVNNTLFGIGHWGTGDVVVGDSILWNNGDDVAGSLGDYSVTYCDIGDGDFASATYGNISADPLFVAGEQHSCYLSQTAAGQGSDSPCLDAGSYTPTILGLDGGTTRTDDAPDADEVDMGYHAWPDLEITSIGRGSDDVTITWVARPGVSYVVEWSANRVSWNDVPVGEQDSWTDTNAASYMEKYYRVREDTFDGGGGGSSSAAGAMAAASTTSPSSLLVGAADAEESAPGNVRRGAGNVRR